MKFIIGVIVMVLVAGGLWYVTQQNSGQIGIYCGEGGVLVNKMPVQSHRSYCMKILTDTTNFNSTVPATLRFSIIDDQGNTLKSFETVHKKIMHFIIVRKDLNNFQHLHPEFDAVTGEFTLSNFLFPSDGPYRLFADFTPSEGMNLGVTIYQDVNVGDMANYTPQNIGNTATSKTFDGYEVALMNHGTMLMFTITQNGKPVTDLENYLGALGHSVILREGTLDFIHAHPMDVAKQNGTVNFMVDFPETGKYKVFTQFQRGGNVFTTDFVVNAEQGEAGSMTMPGMNHSTH